MKRIMTNCNSLNPGVAQEEAVEGVGQSLVRWCEQRAVPGRR